MEYNIWSELLQYCDSVYGAHVYRGGVFPGMIFKINKKQIICHTQHILKIFGWRLKDVASVNVKLFQRCVLGILLFEGERE